MLERFLVEALAAAVLAIDEHVGEKAHFLANLSLAGAGLAAPAVDVEGKAARRVAAQARFGRERVELADLVEQTDIGSGHRARRLADRRLIDLDDSLQGFPAGDLLVRARPPGELAEMELQTFVEDFPHQGALAGPGDAGDAGPHAERESHVEILEIVRLGAADGEPLVWPIRAAGRAVCLAERRYAPVGESGLFLISSGVPTDDVAAAHAGAGTQVDDQIGRLNGRLVVLDDQHAVAQLFEPPQRAQQHVVVARMKPMVGSSRM